MKIRTILEEAKESNDIAVQYKDMKVTYKELYTAVTKVAYLLREYRNEIILLYLPNCINYYIAYFAVLELDSVVAPIHHLNTIYNLKAVLNKTKSRLLITHRSQKYKVQELEMHCLYIDENILDRPMQLNKSKFECEDSTAILIETSGSTSTPKLVMLTNENIIDNIIALKKTIGEVQANEKGMITSFLGSSHGNTSEMLFYLYYKIPVVLYDGIICISKLLNLLSKLQITIIHLVSSILVLLCKTDEDVIIKFDLSKLSRIGFGSSLFPKELLANAIKRFPNTIFVQEYGLTEAAPIVSTLTKKDWLSKFGSIGKQLEGVEIRIVSLNKGEENIGELQIRGTNVTPGYYKNPEENQLLFDGSWLQTKDLVYLDQDNYLYFLGRKGRTIKSSGYRINLEEIESTILSFSGINCVYVYGIEDEVRENSIYADVVPKEDYTVNVQDIVRHCSKFLPSYKIPHKVRIVETLEYTVTGKVKIIKH